MEMYRSLIKYKIIKCPVPGLASFQTPTGVFIFRIITSREEVANIIEIKIPTGKVVFPYENIDDSEK